MTFQIVMAQFGSSSSKQENLDKAEKALQEATSLHQADLVVFPEAFMSFYQIGTPRERKLEDAEPLEGHFVTTMQSLAKRYGVWVIFGTRETTEDSEDDRVYNSTVIIDADGQITGHYRKTHLYDAFGAQESRDIKPGTALFEPIDTPFGKLGLFVCYELRFPEIARYQALHGADVIIVPSGWVRGPVKERHWENLVTTRALENTAYVVAVNQVNEFYIGQSLIVDPMGVVVARGAETETLIPYRIDLERVHEVRTKLPSHIHRQAHLYG
ncbi:Predicted amidohydrolase [Paenibacillus algorifonticola]|uniref:Predicted amidohydrolase n=1 Tax=Paenibacillus algorifonticola TaxID=684063 RepID=A0A1I2B744_9BACL|nr:carbon-nitrogen hydrolase family protein [Paenibacillus algorifonticola]SFE51974.1 Predicted amidohydrolase [Paenibacillus algorifonticola]